MFVSAVMSFFSTSWIEDIEYVRRDKKLESAAVPFVNILIRGQFLSWPFCQQNWYCKDLVLLDECIYIYPMNETRFWQSLSLAIAHDSLHLHKSTGLHWYLQNLRLDVSQRCKDLDLQTVNGRERALLCSRGGTEITVSLFISKLI